MLYGEECQKLHLLVTTAKYVTQIYITLKSSFKYVSIHQIVLTSEIVFIRKYCRYYIIGLCPSNLCYTALGVRYQDILEAGLTAKPSL